MNLFRLSVILSGLMFCLNCSEVHDPAPFGAIPSSHQIEWQKMEYYMFIHFGPNTFTNVEWGHGKEDPKVFNPSDLDCRQWASIAKDAGMKAIIITAKHHDGFCLWPSKYSTHTVRETNWKDGKGDILKELSEACKEYGLKFGVYLSPWDQNHPAYGTPEYNEIFSNTLKEVLGNYGHVFEQWFDGACGEGPTGKKQVYDWGLFHKTVFSLQPHAVIFSDVGPGCRWMGNESGVAGETNWSTLNTSGFEPGKNAPSTEVLNKGDMNGENWIPAEVDVSIRPGWFYSANTDNKVKTIDKLMDIYYTSIGRNGNLLLNVPPDVRGKIHPNDSTRLMEFRQTVEKEFENKITKNIKLKATNTRGNSKKYDVSNLIDGNYDSYWASDNEVLTAEIEIDLGTPTAFNRILLQEYIPLGQRVKAFEVSYWDGSKWSTIDKQTTIGYKRILRFPTVESNKVRISITDALACPVLSEIALFNAPELKQENANEEGVKLPSEAKILDKSSEAKDLGRAENAIDGKKETIWTTVGCNSGKKDFITIDLGKEVVLKGFTYLPTEKEYKLTINQKEEFAGCNILSYNFYTSMDAKNWKKVISEGRFDNMENNPILQTVNFPKESKARYIKLESLNSVGGKFTSVAEIGIIE